MRKVYSQNPLTANELIELVNSRVLTLAATVRPDGRPHLSPTDLIVIGSNFYLGVDHATARFRSLRKNPGVMVMLADGWEAPGNPRRNHEFSGHEERNSSKGPRGSEAEIWLGHRRDCRVPAREDFHVEGKIARR
jgi:hypothetical protein